MSAVDLRPLLTGLPPIVDRRAVVLVLGSFPSERSLAWGQYYAHPRNHFWPLMQSIFGIDQRLSYEERTEQLRARGVGVWDVIASCRRPGSADQAIRDEAVNPVVELIEAQPLLRIVAFNGGKAEETARRFAPALFGLPGIECHRLPSTSLAHVRPLAEKQKAWSQLRRWVEERR